MQTPADVASERVDLGTQGDNEDALQTPAVARSGTDDTALQMPTDVDSGTADLGK